MFYILLHFVLVALTHDRAIANLTKRLQEDQCDGQNKQGMSTLYGEFAVSELLNVTIMVLQSILQDHLKLLIHIWLIGCILRVKIKIIQIYFQFSIRKLYFQFSVFSAHKIQKINLNNSDLLISSNWFLIQKKNASSRRVVNKCQT